MSGAYSDRIVLTTLPLTDREIERPLSYCCLIQLPKEQAVVKMVLDLSKLPALRNVLKLDFKLILYKYNSTLWYNWLHLKKNPLFSVTLFATAFREN